MDAESVKPAASRCAAVARAALAATGSGDWTLEKLTIGTAPCAVVVNARRTVTTGKAKSNKLPDHLSGFPEVEVTGCENRYRTRPVLTGNDAGTGAVINRARPYGQIWSLVPLR